MEFMIKANGLKRSSYEYSIAESKERFDKIKEAFSTGIFSKHPNTGSPDQTPIFILGMPRSGTSLVEQILASNADVFGAGEINDLAMVFHKPGRSLLSRPSPDSNHMYDKKIHTEVRSIIDCLESASYQYDRELRKDTELRATISHWLFDDNIQNWAKWVNGKRRKWNTIDSALKYVDQFMR